MIRWLNLGVVLLTLVSFLTPFVAPDAFWPISAFGPLVLWLLLLQLLLIAVFGYFRKRIAWLNVACLAVGSFLIFRLFGFNGQSDILSVPAVTVLSLNTHFFSSQGSKWPPEDIRAAFDTWKADIYMLQEAGSAYFSGPYRRILTIDSDHPYYYKPDGSGLMLVSRYPLKLIDQHNTTNNVNGFFVLDAETPVGTIRLINAHLQSNAITDMADQIATDGNLQQRDTWNTIRGMFGRYAKAAEKRAQQARMIKEVVDRSPHPVILGGDFNDVPASYVYHLLRKDGLKDAFLEAGRGLGVTFAGSLPGLRIDYLMASPELQVTDFQRFEADFSDHYSIQATFSK